MLRGSPILLYHRIGPRDGSPMDRYTVSPGRFRSQMAQLAAGGWNVLPLEELVRSQMRTGRGRHLAITFDDGFASNREHAWPALESYGFPATTFIVTRELGGTNAWDDAGMPRYALLDASNIRSANPALMTFQSHSCRHAALPTMDSAQIERDVRDSRTELEQLLGRSVTLFAYPFGALNRIVREAVRSAGYLGACSCRGGRNNHRTDPYLLRRVEIHEEDKGWRLRLKLATGLNLD